MSLKTNTISLNISDKLTSISCGHVIVELIKFIAYQRLQIPYTYQWLKQIVNKKKAREEQGIKDNLQSERHYRTVSTALDNLDFIIKNLLLEISGPSMPHEVCLTLGSTPVTCKEVYRFILPTLCHKPQCQSTHILKDQKLQSNVFRSLVTSDALSQAFSNPLPPTNMHVFIRKRQLYNQVAVPNSNSFLPASGSRIPKSSRVFVIDFRSPNIENITCCNQFEIFGDTISDNLSNLKIKCDDSVNDREFTEIQSSDSVKWFQSSYMMKGFKDCIVNDRSITNLWLE